MRLTETSPNARNIHFDCRVQTRAAFHDLAHEEGPLYPGWMRFLIIVGLSGGLWFMILYVFASLFG